ncbi:MAG TPA: glycine zipper family protein [Roseiarcus sp.]|nr:glycine zipper family protein [Roseiarcus sp.]
MSFANKPLLLMSVIALAAFAALAHDNAASAASKSQRCDAYARNAARSTPTRGGPVRGAVAGAAIGSFSANAGAGAAIGAGVGATRRAVQRGRSYRYYYDRCMAR